jgi:hypothetical protein
MWPLLLLLTCNYIELSENHHSLLTITLGGTHSDNLPSLESPANLPTSRNPHPNLPIRSNEIALERKKAIKQQYLTPQEEKTLVAYVLQCADNGFPLPVKALRRLALVIRQRRSSACSTGTRAGRVHQVRAPLEPTRVGGRTLTITCAWQVPNQSS